ncbi:MAG: endonuclease V [Candidatus Nanohalobium sp.]
MKVKNSQFLPGKPSDQDEMKEMQRKIARQAVFSDSTDYEPEEVEDMTVAGIDQAFTDEKSVSAAVALKDGEIIEEVSAAEKTPMPYTPGLLAFREGGAIVSALEKLEVEPDLLILDGSGRIHFRQAGIATHIGVMFDVPAIGVAKNLLCGEVNLPEKMQEGDKRKIYADDSVENLDEGVLGYAYQSRQYSSPNRSINPLYISPGHRLGPGTSVKIVSRFCKGYKLPEPTRIADRKVSELKENTVDVVGFKKLSKNSLSIEGS